MVHLKLTTIQQQTLLMNEHIDHSTITVGSGQGLSGGGTINVSRSLTLDTGSSHFTEGVDKRLTSLIQIQVHTLLHQVQCFLRYNFKTRIFSR